MKTVDKWIADNDKTLNTTTWLKYDKADRDLEAGLDLHTGSAADTTPRSYDLLLTGRLNF